MYEFFYPNSNVRQRKILIKHEDYIKIRALPEKDFKRELNILTGGKEWFTNKSPLFDSISTNQLLIYNGTYSTCFVTLL